MLLKWHFFITKLFCFVLIMSVLYQIHEHYFLTNYFWYRWAKRVVQVYSKRYTAVLFVEKGQNAVSVRYLWSSILVVVASVIFIHFFLYCLHNFEEPTISDITYWQFWLFYRFSKIEVRAKKWILGFLFNLIEYFNLEEVGRLPGYILSLVGPFLNFWILRS